MYILRKYNIKNIEKKQKDKSFNGKEENRQNDKQWSEKYHTEN